MELLAYKNEEMAQRWTDFLVDFDRHQARVNGDIKGELIKLRRTSDGMYIKDLYYITS